MTRLSYPGPATLSIEQFAFANAPEKGLQSGRRTATAPSFLPPGAAPASIRSMLEDRIALSEEVADARAEGRGIVALESTVIAHGLPAPQNLETAAAMEDAVRQAGAVPATVALCEGRIRIGLTEAERARLADPAERPAKASRRDLAALLAAGALGATTVAATMICARAAGISVFATGGIGGVHRGAETSFDISADLTELARTPVLTVASGAKSILDLPKTREVLETAGVPVLGWRTDRFPAFHSRDSGLLLDRRLDEAAAVAETARLHWALGLGGLLLCNPVPEDAALRPEEVSAWLAEAERAAAADDVTGPAITPYLLDRLARASGGRTLIANRALLIDNARVGGAVAAALAVSRAAMETMP
jgi:pseudouridine-5'-phosphate glycosidase